jgi:hypothetical protein
MQLKGKKGFALIVNNGSAEIAPYRYDGGDEWMVKTARTPIWLRDYDEDLDIHFEGTGKGGIAALIHVIAVADNPASLRDPKTISLPEQEQLAAVSSLIRTEIAGSRLSSIMKTHSEGLFDDYNIASTTYRAVAQAGDFAQGAASSLNILTTRERVMLQGMHDAISSALNGGGYSFR